MNLQVLPGLLPTSRRETIGHFWGVSGIENTRGNIFEDDAYFEYFETQCRLARQHDHPEIQVCTHRNICDIVRQLKAGEDREKIKAELSLKANSIQDNSERFLSNAIDLTVRLWLMVHIGYVHPGVTGQTALSWQKGCLKDCVTVHFQHQRILTDTVKLEKGFNARNIERIANVTIRWTTNLVDHLKFTEDGNNSILHIFHHAAFLTYHRGG